MERYREYKDSGVQWLGEIPRHWKTVRVKALLSERVDKSDTGLEEPLSMSQKYGIIPTREMDVVPNMASTYIGAKRVFKQDLVFNKLKAHLGVFAISKYDGLVSPDYAVYTPNERTYLPFMEYVFHTPLYIGEFTRKATGVAIGLTRLYTNGLFAVPFLYPPLSEQHSIVSFLDDKCGKIDKMLEGKQKQIELLAEMKQRIIADAVTRGLNPDVELKESGIFWIRHVPSHWNVRRLGHVLRKENRERPINAELLVCTNKAKVIKRGESKMGLIADSEDVYQGVKKGDLLIHGMDTWHGAIAISEYDGMCTPVVHVCTSNEDVGFISLYLRYMAMMKVFKLISNGVRQNTSDFRSWGKVAVIPCPLPPLDEQHAIVSYITDKTSKIDTLTSKLQQEIESIKEYKQRLISDVVTGQIKVS